MIGIGNQSICESFMIRRIPVASILLVFLIIGVSISQTFAQKGDLPEGVVPPPLSVLSDKESDSFKLESSIKKRTKLAIELMEGRVLNSETSSENDDYQETINQLGSFRAIMNRTLRDLNHNDYRKGILKQYKKFEIALREFIPRLEIVRRSLPFSHAYHVTVLIESVREVRKESIESFFGDTVIPNGKK